MKRALGLTLAATMMLPAGTAAQGLIDITVPVSNDEPAFRSFMALVFESQYSVNSAEMRFDVAMQAQDIESVGLAISEMQAIMARAHIVAEQYAPQACWAELHAGYMTSLEANESLVDAVAEYVENPSSQETQNSVDATIASAKAADQAFERLMNEVDCPWLPPPEA